MAYFSMLNKALKFLNLRSKNPKSMIGCFLRQDMWPDCQKYQKYERNNSTNKTHKHKLITYSPSLLVHFVLLSLTPSTPAVPNCCCSKGPALYWSNQPFLIFDIRVLWHSGNGIGGERVKYQLTKQNQLLTPTVDDFKSVNAHYSKRFYSYKTLLGQLANLHTLCLFVSLSATMTDRPHKQCVYRGAICHLQQH